jgi:hypothetical protein
MKLTLRGKSFRHRPIWARVWWWRLLYSRGRKPPAKPDAEAVEIARIDALIGRLEIAAMIGSVTAAGRLADMAVDRVGLARRRMAKEAMARLQGER